MNSFFFPVYLLGAGSTPKLQFQAIVGWSVVSMALDLPEFDVEEVNGQITPEGYHQAAIEGLHRFKLQESGAKWCVAGFHSGEAWIARRTGQFGRPSNVIIGKEILLEVLGAVYWEKPSGLSWRQFKVLCAVNCGIGDKSTPWVLRRDFLRALSVGLKTSSGVFNCKGQLTPESSILLSPSGPMGTPPSIRQLRNDLQLLEERGFIGRVEVSRRSTAYYRPHVCDRATALAWLKKRYVANDRLTQRRREEAAIRQMNQIRRG